MEGDGKNESGLARWAERFREATDNDSELKAHGKYYTCAFMLDAGEHRVVVRMNRGKVDGIAIDPGPLDEHYQFAVRWTSEGWRKFAQPEPPPMYHGLWAATFRAGMRVEGDLLAMMQNLRCFTRQLELMRTTGAPVGKEGAH
jgi:hypothetical protein